MPPSTGEAKKRIPHSAQYTSRIIKAGALIGDTKTLLSHWDVDASVRETIKRMQRDNVFGKTSRSRVKDVLAIFRRRYLSDKSVTKALVTLVRKKFPSLAVARILYFHSARADRLLYDAVTEIIFPLRESGLIDVNVGHLQRPLTQWMAEGETSGHWSEPTITRIAQGLLSAPRDFDVLQGSVNKKIAPAYFPIESFAYVVFYLRQRQPSGAQLIGLPDWKLFFLGKDNVERLLFEAHQRGLLEYHVAANVT